MKKIAIFLILFISIFSNYTAASQGQSDYTIQTPQIVSPSPQAKLYMRYGEIPVDLSSGVPNIKIPIYTLKAGNLTIPIDISYHSSGNKVEDVSSAVGLGWVLNAGGIITQTVCGAPDHLQDPEFISSIDARTRFENDKIATGASNKSLNPNWYYLLKGCPYHNPSKTISDKYFYNFNGNIGGFRKDIQTKEIKTIPYSPVIIKQTDSEHFQIIDTEGNVWDFKRFETVVSNTCIPSSYEYYLERIRLVNSNDEVKFFYTTGVSYVKKNMVENATWHMDPEWSFEYDARYGIWYMGLQRCNPKTDYSFQRDNAFVVKPILLSKIEYKGTRIDFKYKSDRQDIMSERLEKISISADNQEKNVDFFNKDSYLGDRFTNYRMLLDGVKVNNDSYFFEYNTDVILPDYATYSTKCNVDFWGYYNGVNSDFWIPFDFKVSGPYETVLEYQSRREPNPICSQSGILKKIIYPTKGRTVFTYEQNRGENVYEGIIEKGSSSNYFGGLRIEKIENYEGSSLISTKKYEYEGGTTIPISKWQYYTEKTFLQIPNYPEPNGNYVRQGGVCGNVSYGPFDIDWISRPYKMISSSELYPTTSPSGASIFYSKVTEYNGGESNNAGKTEYFYRGNGFVSRSRYNDFGYSEPVELREKKIYTRDNDDYKIVQEVVNEYSDTLKNSFIAGVSIEDNNQIFLFDPTSYDIRQPQSHSVIKEFYYNSFNFTNMMAINVVNLLSRTDKTDYTENGAIKTTINYIYDDQYRLLTPIETLVSGSDNTTYREKLDYPFNFSEVVYQKMVSKNMISPIIQKASYKNNTQFLERIKNEYREDGDRIVVDVVKSKKGTYPEENRLKYHNYDIKGNPVYMTKDDADKIVYLWSYNYQYPIAEIKGKTYEEVRDALGGQTAVDNLAINNNPAIESLSTSLRSAFQSQPVLVTCYAYKPLAGISMVIDPRGVTTIYEYDDFGRLKWIQDMNGNIVQSYEYNYKNQ